MKNMFRAAFTFATVIFLMPVAASTVTSSHVSVDVLEAPNTVMGKLGIALGKIVTIEADIIDGGRPNAKTMEGVTLLQVRSVNGQSLRKPCSLPFRWFETVPTMPLTGRVRLIVYETGAFTGVSDEAFAYIPAVASQSFHFESSIVVLRAF